MVYIKKVASLFTSSTDRTIRIWVIDPPSEQMQYPRFKISQKIQDFTSINKQLDMDVWINCIELNDTERLSIYAGDSEGSLLKFKAPKEWRTECEFDFDKKFKGIHRSGIYKILDVKKESMTFSIGYD
jgi:hypothetical protein